jgi:hypothetical protein
VARFSVHFAKRELAGASLNVEDRVVVSDHERAGVRRGGRRPEIRVDADWRADERVSVIVEKSIWNFTLTHVARGTIGNAYAEVLSSAIAPPSKMIDHPPRGTFVEVGAQDGLRDQRRAEARIRARVAASPASASPITSPPASAEGPYETASTPRNGHAAGEKRTERRGQDDLAHAEQSI